MLGQMDYHDGHRQQTEGLFTIIRKFCYLSKIFLFEKDVKTYTIENCHFIFGSS